VILILYIRCGLGNEEIYANELCARYKAV
jgi:hypothetical protein